MKIWTPKDGDIYIFNRILVGKFNSIVIDKVVGFIVPRKLISYSKNDNDCGLYFSFQLVGIPEILYCRAENFQDFKEAIDPQTAKVESNEVNMTYREAKLEHALRTIVKWSDFPDTGSFYDIEETQKVSYGAAYGSNGERDYMRSIARKALEVKL
ncbi:hypothetical protein M0R04_04595 [Candidatus Dojkabacteria bacterium]|jgi:hypothetical protein|nr:hypothetical protein [Candidatus Dojkabacteria bacterium]